MLTSETIEANKKIKKEAQVLASEFYKDNDFSYCNIRIYSQKIKISILLQGQWKTILHSNSVGTELYFE